MSALLECLDEEVRELGLTSGVKMDLRLLQQKRPSLGAAAATSSPVGLSRGHHVDQNRQALTHTGTDVHDVRVRPGSDLDLQLKRVAHLFAVALDSDVRRTARPRDRTPRARHEASPSGSVLYD